MNKPTYEELAAQVEVLKNMLLDNYKLDMQMRSVDEIELPKFLSNFEKELPAPAACLAQHDAAVGRAGFIEGVNWSVANVGDYASTEPANQYAERILQEKTNG